ncbi:MULTISPECIES: carboxypeptidase-like regulatory domain-containing protein [unclassified Saccharicrinis]|uniref:carboxypeptidase-like regulatory domain-containing protein n=1 Tax=unclassified Saccharicrinis TaxID=2646859 RepID=UPI003D351C02
MRATKRLINILIIILLSTYCYSQDEVLDEKIDVKYKSIKIEALLDSIHLTYDFDFSYDPSDLPVDSVIHIYYEQHSLFTILQDIFKNYDLSFKGVGRQIIISHQKRELALRNYITIQGTVISSDNGQKLPLVNIAVKGEPLGTTTNMEGEFTFLVPRKFVDSEINMSSIGYSPSSIHIPHSDTSVIVSLKPQTIQIKEIKVRFIRPDEIIQRLIENRAQNYFTSPMLLTAFFRETIKQDGKYIEVSEAVLDIYKSSYLNTFDKEEARFVKGRKKVEDEDISVARLKLAGGPALFSTIDVAKHLDFISGEEGNNYFYMYKGKDIVHDRVVYKVGFKPIVEMESIYYEGELYVDVETFALISADFSMTKKTLRNSDKYLIRKNARKVKSIPVYTRYQVDYRPYGDKWILNSVRGELTINMRDKRNKIKSEYHASADLLITNAQHGKGLRIRYSEAFKTNYVLADKIVGYDPMFWKDFNVIHPEEELVKVFKSTPVEINLVPQPKKTKP